jgi:hypothetical protein
MAQAYTKLYPQLSWQEHIKKYESCNHKKKNEHNENLSYLSHVTLFVPAMTRKQVVKIDVNMNTSPLN